MSDGTWLRDRAAIVGFGHTDYGKRGQHAERGYQSIVVEAVQKACDDAGIRPSEIDGWASYSGDPTDAGQHCSLAKGPNDEMGIAYMDATNDNLMYIDLMTRMPEVVDDGIAPPNLRMVGADASLVFDNQGRPAIAYQDPTEIDVVYARRLGTPPMWNTEVIYGDAPPGAMVGVAAGFYVSQGRRAETAYISNVDVSFTEDGERTLDLRVLTKLLD